MSEKKEPDAEAVTRPSPARLAETRSEPDELPEDEPPTEILPPPGSGVKILIVDDDADVISTLREILSEEGYRVWTASDGLEGLERLFTMPRCDLILLDLMMPRASGMDFLRVFDKTQHSQIPVLIISAYRPRPGELDDRFIFLGKPLALEALLATVRKHVEASRFRRDPE